MDALGVLGLRIETWGARVLEPSGAERVVAAYALRQGLNRRLEG
jgi:hypothetical protein